MSNSYVGADGLRRCEKCNGKLETMVTFRDITRKVKCICSCKEKEIEEWEKVHVDRADKWEQQMTWNSCKYEDHKLHSSGMWEDGKWYEWLDKYDNREIARMKRDMLDHFYPPTKVIKEENVIAFREIAKAGGIDD